MVFWRKKDGAERGGARTRPGPVSTGEPGPAAAEAAARVGESTTEILSGNPDADSKSVRVLLDAIARVSESRDLESLLDYVVDRSVQATGAERGFLILLDEGSEEHVVRVARERNSTHPGAGRPIDPEDVKYSTSVVQRVLAENAPMRTTVQSDAEALELGTSVFDLKLRAVMCVPLTTDEDTPHPGEARQRGALYVDSKAATREFGDQDLALFFALAQHIAIALENAQLNIQSLEKVRLERSLEIATEIQSGLMPKAPPIIDGYDVYGWFRPAEHATGDFYDFVRTKDGDHAIVVGDVTGHGIGPALVTATAQASLRSYAKVLADPGQVVSMLNQDLAERIDTGMFLTLFVGVLGSKGPLQFVNAGHTPPLLWRQATQKVETIDGTGPALGMVDDFAYEAGTPIELEPGDTLVAFTDGLAEARSPGDTDSLYGDDGVRRVLERVAPEDPSAQVLIHYLVESVLEFSGGALEDDMTVVVVRRRLEGQPKGGE